MVVVLGRASRRSGLVGRQHVRSLAQASGRCQLAAGSRRGWDRPVFITGASTRAHVEAPGHQGSGGALRDAEVCPEAYVGSLQEKAWALSEGVVRAGGLSMRARH